MKRSRLAAIGAATLALAVAGTLMLTVEHVSPRQALSAATLTPAHHRSAGVTQCHVIQNRNSHHFIGVALEAHIISNAESFAAVTKLHPSLVEIYTRFGAPFPTAEVDRISQYGSTPFIQLNPRRAPLRRIDRGKFNSYTRKLALQVKAFAHPVILSFGHEMNGHWNGWSRPHATPHQFISAWRLIFRIFKRNHVQNVTWSWDPSHTGGSARPWWPGSRYVDRIGIDGYFRHNQTFKQIFARQLRIIRSFTKKPIFIAETGIARTAGQVRQVRGLFTGVRRWHLAGFIWFNVNRLERWRLQHRPGTIEAFRRCTRRMPGYK